MIVGIASCRGDNIPLPNDFLVTLNKVEASGRHSNVPDGDGGHAKGPFQIHYKYWQDSGITGSYSQCSDYDYSVRVVTGYLNRYARKAITAKDYETLARVHNGGPNGMSHSDTLTYWKKFKKALTQRH